MVELSFTPSPTNTFPFGFFNIFYVNASSNQVQLHGSSEESMCPNTHRFMRTDRDVNYIFGVTKLFNKTTNTDITKHILKVYPYWITVDTNYISHDDLIEVHAYTDWEGIRNDYDQSDGKLTQITQDMVEQLIRFVSNLDRIDFGNYTPPFDNVLDIVGSNQNTTKYSYHPRIFFNSSGFFSTDTISGSSNLSGGKITRSPQTIVNYSVSNPSIVGGFIGDPSFASKKGGNENYINLPTPMYLTEMTFFCKLNNTSFDPDKAEAIKLNISMDGLSRAFGTAPNYETTSGHFPIRGSFGTDQDLILSFCGDEDYSGLPPTYTYPKTFDDSYDYYIWKIPIGINRLNSGITVSASLLSNEEGVEEIEDYLFTIGGVIPVSWTE